MNRRHFSSAAVAGLAQSGLAQSSTTLPRRALGKTGFQTSLLGIGTAQLGAPQVTQAEVDHVIGAVIDEGINYVDTAPIYGLAEERLGRALRGRRHKVFLVSKVEATSNQDATWQLEESLRKLQTDHLDAVHIHNVGRTDRFPSMEILLGPDGALQALRDAKKKGLIRHIGMTCHLRPARALPVIETGHIELVMCAANFVDVHTYNFEGTVFEAARKKGIGIVAMKVLGGQEGEGAKLSAREHYGVAVRYALGIPGLSVAILGMKNVAEVKTAVAAVRNYSPLTPHELTQLRALGQAMARAWGPLRGPVA
jgi:aryl-alcohol dehydrogenase-like predicted oxidoreductase